MEEDIIPSDLSPPTCATEPLTPWRTLVRPPELELRAYLDGGKHRAEGCASISLRAPY